jgi:catechol 2,3-dioxygenase
MIRRGDIAHIGYVELLTPKPAESLWFFEDVMGMEREAQEGPSVFMRGFGDYERYCLKLTEAAQSGLGHVALRAADDEALERVAASVEASGRGEGWSDGDLGHGRAYRFSDPDGRRFEVYHESDRYRPPAHLVPAMLNQHQRHTGRGIGVRRLEHVNLISPAVRECREFLEQALGFRSFEVIQLDDGREYGAWLSSSIQGHELIYILERRPIPGRLHHTAFWVDTREEVLRAADLFQDNGIFIEAGPAKHTPVHSFYLYVYEPGGNRIEVTSGGHLLFDPTPNVTTWWTEDRYKGSRAWGRGFPPSFDTYATPPYEEEPT